MSLYDMNEIDASTTATKALADQYAGRSRDVDLSAFVAQFADLPDDRLAEVIEADGRHRIKLGLPMTLDRYLDAIADLAQRPDPLDAAIDVTLRAMSRGRRGPTRTDPDAVSTLVSRYPQFEQMILEAAALNNAVWSTATLRDRIDAIEARQSRTLPCDFGPAMPDGAARYELRRFLGSGAFGTVYLAVDRQLSEPDHPAMVAIKILDEGKSKQSKQGGERRAWSRHRLAEEATKARRVDHPNVVRVLDRGVSDRDEDYIVYELVEGGNLDQWLDEQIPASTQDTSSGLAIDPRKTARLIANIARGVQAAHRAGLVHCDLKPGNIILTAEGEPKVADFGIAVRYKRNGSSPTRSDNDADVQESGDDIGHPIGNLAFISPEQYRMDDGAFTVPSDIFALGGMLFYLLTGELPNGDTRTAIARTHDPDTGRRIAPSPRERRPHIDPDLDAICRRAMAPEPEDRYSAAGELASDLDAWLRFEPIRWTKPSTARVLRLWARRRPGAAVATVLSVVAVLGGTSGALILNHRAIEADLRADAAEMAREVERARAETAQIRAEEKERRIQAANDAITRSVEAIESMVTDENREAQFIPMLWALEYLAAPRVLLAREGHDTIIEARIDAVERIAARLTELGREHDLLSLSWRANLAYWYAHHAEFDRALSIIETDRQQWRDLLPPDDGMWSVLDTIEACAEAGRRMHRLRSDLAPDPESIRNELQAVAERIEQLRSPLEEVSPGTPLLKFAMQTLVELYDQDMLDRQMDQDSMIDALYRLEESAALQ